MQPDPVERTVDRPPSAEAGSGSRWSWRGTVLSLALFAVLGVTFGPPVYRSLQGSPEVGDRHRVAYEAEDRCGYLMVRTAGLEVRGNAVESGFDEPVPAGDGTLVLTSVARDGGGYEVDGVLELADGSELPMHGWGGKTGRFWTLGCAIRTT
jgi:hypothetical protein